MGQLEVEKDIDIRQVVLEKEHIALCGKNVLIITNEELEVVCTITEKFSIKSAFWER